MIIDENTNLLIMLICQIHEYMNTAALIDIDGGIATVLGDTSPRYENLGAVFLQQSVL